MENENLAKNHGEDRPGLNGCARARAKDNDYNMNYLVERISIFVERISILVGPIFLLTVLGIYFWVPIGNIVGIIWFIFWIVFFVVIIRNDNLWKNRR